MGCDIHLHVEIKFKGEDFWQHYNAVNVTRNYGLFALMAGVRNYDSVVPISGPKGLPEDLSFITKFDYEKIWEPDAHSESWLSSQEISQIDEFGFSEKNSYRYPFGYLFGGGYCDFYKYRDEYPEEIEDFRFVFWFDN